MDICCSAIFRSLLLATAESLHCCSERGPAARTEHGRSVIITAMTVVIVFIIVIKYDCLQAMAG